MIFGWMNFSFFLVTICLSLYIYVCVLLMVAFFVLLERKIMASIQRRVGPNYIGFGGLFQSFADALKLVLKESMTPIKSMESLFLAAPLLTFWFSLIMWAILPINSSGAASSPNIGLIIVFVLSALGIYGVILAGLVSNNKYALLGMIRTVAQLISYEVYLGFTLLPILLWTETGNLWAIVESQKYLWNIYAFWPLAVIFLISILVETNRAPFDLPEAEGELVAGFNVEFGSLTFALFFLGEYTNMLTMSFLFVILFLGGWHLPTFTWYEGLSFVETFIFMIKVFPVVFFFIWMRASLPRYRYDNVMTLGWKILLPTAFGSFMVYTLLLYLCGFSMHYLLATLMPVLFLMSKFIKYIK